MAVNSPSKGSYDLSDDSDDLSDLPDIRSVFKSTFFQESDIIIYMPSYSKYYWPALITKKESQKQKKRNSKSTQDLIPSRKFTSRRVCSNSQQSRVQVKCTDILYIRFLNYPDTTRANKTLFPPSFVTLYTLDTKKTLITEWETSPNSCFREHLYTALEEADTYIRKRATNSLAPGTAQQQYLQVKRARLDFDFEGIQHTEEDKNLQINDIPYVSLKNELQSKPLVRCDTSLMETLNSSIYTNINDGFDDRIQLEDNQFYDEKPELTKIEFNIFLKRLKKSKSHLKKIYLQEIPCTDNKIFFSKTNSLKNELRISSMESIYLIPYKLNTDQKDTIIDYLMEYIKAFYTACPSQYKNFNDYAYAFDVMLPQCMKWIQQSIEESPLVFHTPKKLKKTSNK